MQSSYVTVGNYPGIEARIYGSKGALIARLVEEFGECQTLYGARPDAVEFVRMAIPDRFFPHAYEPGERWDRLFYSNLVHNFMQEIVDGGETNQGNFAQSARVQEIINAVTLSHREGRWVQLPLQVAV
jgi:predicted dehydrogenase